MAESMPSHATEGVTGANMPEYDPVTPAMSQMAWWSPLPKNRGDRLLPNGDRCLTLGQVQLLKVGGYRYGLMEVSFF